MNYIGIHPLHLRRIIEAGIRRSKPFPEAMLPTTNSGQQIDPSLSYMAAIHVHVHAGNAIAGCTIFNEFGEILASEERLLGCSHFYFRRAGQHRQMNYLSGACKSIARKIGLRLADGCAVSPLEEGIFMLSLDKMAYLHEQADTAMQRFICHNPAYKKS